MGLSEAEVATIFLEPDPGYEFKQYNASIHIAGDGEGLVSRLRHYLTQILATLLSGPEPD